MTRPPRKAVILGATRGMGRALAAMLDRKK